MKKTIPGLRLLKLRSFTLIELLVVIAIIAILAGIIMSASTFAIKAAQRVKAFNMATQIQSGVTGYYTEYSLYPVPPISPAKDYMIGSTNSGSDSLGTANKTAWGTLTCVLSGNFHPSTGLPFTTANATITNSRGIAYLSMKASDVDNGDAPKNPLPTGAETYFNITIDSDYDGVLGVSPSSVTMPDFTKSTYTATGGSSSAGCAVWANCNGSTSTTNVGSFVHTF